MGLAYDEDKSVNVWKWLTLILPFETNSRYNNIFLSLKQKLNIDVCTKILMARFIIPKY